MPRKTRHPAWAKTFAPRDENYRILTTMAAELLAAAAQPEREHRAIKLADRTQQSARIELKSKKSR